MVDQWFLAEIVHNEEIIHLFYPMSPQIGQMLPIGVQCMIPLQISSLSV